MVAALSGTIMFATENARKLMKYPIHEEKLVILFHAVETNKKILEVKDGERKNKVKLNQMAGNWFLQKCRGK